MQSSSEEVEDVEKQWSSEEEEPVVMPQSADEAMKCPGLDHPRHNKKERPKHNESNIR